jgi:phosphate-selective porin OprO and OprP
MYKSNGRPGPSKDLVSILASILSVAALEAGQLSTVPAERALATTARPPAAQEIPPQKESQKKPPRISFRWDDHPSLRFGRDTNIDFRARVEGQILDSEPGLGDSDGFDIVRRRVGIEGRIAGDIDFQLEREIDTEDPWRDVYVNYRRFDIVRVQAGKFKMPFSLDENTSSANLDFAYRSMAANQLAPGRDRGVMVHGRVFRSIVQYEAGWFAGEGRNARVNNPERVSGGESLAGRLSVQPFRQTDTPLSDMEVGLAFTDTEVPEGIAGFRGRTTLDGPLFPAYLWVRGSRTRTGLEARWRPGPFSVKAEYIRVATERQEQSVEDTDLPALTATGWYVSGTWFITGERKADGGARPRRTLIRGGVGAIEVAGRIERLEFANEASDDGPPSVSPRSPVVLPNSDRAVTLGVNWFPVRGVKIQTNFVHETIEDPERGPFPERASFWSSILRIQLSI